MDISSVSLTKNEFVDHSLIACTKRTLLRLFIVTFSAPTRPSMMPLAPSSIPCAAHKPKIGFSIDSIVGGIQSKQISRLKPNHKSQLGAFKDNNEFSQATCTAFFPDSSFPQIFDQTIADNVRKSEHVRAFFNSSTHVQSHRHQQDLSGSGNANSYKPIPIAGRFHRLVPQGSNNSSAIITPGITSLSNVSTKISNPRPSINSRLCSSKDNTPCQYRLHNHGVTTDSVTSLSPSPPPSVITANSSRSFSPQGSDCHHKSPPNIPHVVASRTMQPLTGLHPHIPSPSQQHLPPVGPNGMPQFATFPKGIMNFAAAAAAVAAQYHHQQQLPGWMAPGPHPPHHPATAAAHPLYPWLLAKHSRQFPHRFGPGSDLPGHFLLQPFRKPKRIRTAFSPGQLLQLEHAFERNHYVVGSERKQLANSLSLSETQVKVWFQNRRTKHKRTQHDEEEVVKKSGSGSGSANDSNLSSAISADSSTRNYNSEEMMMIMLSEEEEEEGDDEEEIIMDDDDMYHKEQISEHLHQCLKTVP